VTRSVGSSSPESRGRIAIAILFLVFAAVSLAQRPYGSEFVFSDHFAHMNAARLFPRVGLDLWKRPIAEMFRPASEAEQARAPEDVVRAGHMLHVPWWPDDKPYVGGWTALPRPYPPGDMVVVAPIALLYSATSLSLAAACHLLILWFLFLAHAAFWLVWRNRPDVASWPYLAAAIASYTFVIFWTLRGFYDGAAMIPLVVCAACIGKGRPLGILATFSLALFIHFRALFYVPWALYGMWRAAKVRAWRDATPLEWVAVVASAALACVAAITLVLVAPALSLLPLESPIHPGHLKAIPLVAFVASLAVGLLAFARARAWLDVAMILWLALMLCSIRQVQAWHAFLLFPWLFAAAPRESVRIARIGFVATVTLAVFL